MLVKKKNIIHTVIATKLAVILMFPFFVQFAHSLEGHDHASVCVDKSLHFHKKNIDCQICEFHFTSFTYNFTEYPDFFQKIYFDEIEESFYALYDSFNQTNIQSRAPPACVV